MFESIKRKRMPQIPSNKLHSVIKKLNGHGIRTSFEFVDIGKIKHIQENFIPEKVANIINEIKNSGKIKPIILSEDNYCLDGNHRTLALKELNKNPKYNLDKINCIRIFENKMKCLVTLREITGQMNYSKNNTMKEVVVYSGRFQPFHKNHYKAYNWLKENYSDADVWIATSNKTEYPKSPFTFSEKQYIINEMFDIPKNNIQRIKNPYFPKEILEQYDSSNTSFIVALGEKDSKRLSRSPYFNDYRKISEAKGYEDEGYYTVVPLRETFHKGTLVDGTLIRKIFADQELNESKKVDFFEGLYSQFNKEVFDLFTDKWDLLNENNIKRFLSEEKDTIKSIISELTTTLAAGADDGPDTWYTTYDDYERVVQSKATQAGMQIYDLLTKQTDIDRNIETNWNYDISDVTYYPAGRRGDEEHPEDPETGLEDPGIDIDKAEEEGEGNEGEPELSDREKYEKYIQRVSARAGWEFMKWMGSVESVD